MTASGFTRPTTTPFPADHSVLQTWAQRLASVDLWADSARLLLAALPTTPTDEERVNGAWVCLRGGQPHEATTLLTNLTAADIPNSPIAALKAATATLCGTPGAYDEFLTVLRATEQPITPTLLRLTAISSAAAGDWERTADAARRLLVILPTDSDMLVHVAVDLTVRGEFHRALNTIECARESRFSCQPDPAADVINALTARTEHDPALMLSAIAFTLTAHPAWHTELNRLAPSGFPAHPVTLPTSRAARAAHRVTPGHPTIATGHPPLWTAASSLTTWLTHQAVRTAKPFTSRLPNALTNAVASALDVTGAVTRQRLTTDNLNSDTHNPTECSCFETDWYSGPEARDYVEQHLQTVTISEPLGITVRRCPTLDKTWLDLPGTSFTFSIDALNTPLAADLTAPIPAEPSYNTGFYL